MAINIVPKMPPEYGPNHRIPQPAGELAVREEPDASKKEVSTSQDTWQSCLKKRLCEKRGAFSVGFPCNMAAGFKPQCFFFAKSPRSGD